MSVLAFIPDGHSVTGWINEAPGLYPRITFSYRPLTCEEFAEYLHHVGNINEKQAQRVIARYLAERIKEWDIKDAKGQTAPINEDTTRRLSRKLSQRLWLIVAGLEGADGVVGQDKSDEDADFRAAMEAAASGRPLPQVREEMERKN